jgi:excisionase family DNA binding protein
MLDGFPDIMNSKDVMSVLDIKKELLYELIKQKKIPAYKIGKKEWRFNKDTLLKHLHKLEAIQ